jgi:NAD+ kinase
MTSTLASKPPSPKNIGRATVVTHREPEAIGSAVARLERVAAEHGVELVEDGADADIAVVLGGDGTMLRALQRFIGSGIPVIGVNFGRVGFLATIQRDELDDGLARVFAGEYDVSPLTTLDVDANGPRAAAVNDVVALSSTRGRMVELAWRIHGEDLGVQPCDGMICSTPTGSTAYNLSNGGPVLVRGLDAMAITFIAPHSLHARPLVVPRGLELEIRNETLDVGVTVIVDGHELTDVGRGERIVVRVGERDALLATLPEATFFRRYSETFSQ